MGLVTKQVTLTTDSAGDAEGYIGPLTGLVIGLALIDSNLDAGLTVEVNPVPQGSPDIFNMTGMSYEVIYQPRVAIHNPDGTEIAGAKGAALVHGQLVAVISDGGDTLTGTIVAYVDDLGR